MSNRLIKVTHEEAGRLNVKIITKDASERYLLQLLLPELRRIEDERQIIFAPNLAHRIFEELVDEQDLTEAMEGFFRVGLTAFAELMMRELDDPDDWEAKLEAIEAEIQRRDTEEAK